MIVRAWLRLRAMLFRSRIEREMQEEIAAHLRRAAERFEASGVPPDEARAAARREFGNVAAIADEARDARGGRAVESLLMDLRYGARRLARTPLSALTMIAVFALGIGCNAALFLFISSIVNSPVPGIGRDETLVRIRGIEHGMITVGREFSYPEYRDYAAQQALFASVAAWTSADVVIGVTNGGGPEEALFSGAATYVTANYFQVLGVRPISGAGLPADARDDGSQPLVAVISYAVWERGFGLAPDVIGRPLDINGTPVTVVGVAPRRFAGARTGGSQMRVWLPLGVRHLVQHAPTDLTTYDSAFLGLAARLQPGVRAGDTLAVVAALGTRSMQLMTKPPSGSRSTDVVPMLAGNYFPPSGETPGIAGRVATMVMPLLILLVTCTNVSALLAGLAIARRREIAVRLSLGASRRRLVRQLTTESVLLAVSAGACALLVLWILLRFVESSVADVYVTIDWRAVLFTLAVAIAAGVVFGLSPALHGTRVAVSEVLKDSAGGAAAPRSRLQSGLVIAQIALTQPLLLGMGALILELREDLKKVPSPVYADRVVDIRFNTNPRYGTLDRAREEVLRRLQARFAALPGTVAIVPQENADDYFAAVVHASDRIGDAVDRRLTIRAQAAPAGYFPLMGMPLVRGRDFAPADREERTAVVIGAAAASRLWPDGDPIGRRLVALAPTPRGGLFTVIGVVDDRRAGGNSDDDAVRLFVPDVRVTGHFLMRTAAPAQPMIPAIRAAANAEAPNLPLVSVRTLDAIESAQRTSLARATAGVAGAGVLALFLSAIGLYALVTFAVRQRVREIGIRTALGADGPAVVRWFLMRGMRLSAAGIGAGLMLSVIVVQAIVAVQGDELRTGIFGLAALVAVVAIAVTLVATWIPARRAAAIDPLLALRTE